MRVNTFIESQNTFFFSKQKGNTKIGRKRNIFLINKTIHLYAEILLQNGVSNPSYCCQSQPTILQPGYLFLIQSHSF